MMCIIRQNYLIFLFTILQQNIDEIKIEDSVDILSEEDSIRIKSEEICTSSAFSVDENKPEVSLGFRYFYHSGSCMSVFLFSTRDF
jgi:hypothetical protein